MSNFKQTIAKLDSSLPVGRSFDMIRRPIITGGKKAVMYMIDGFVKDEMFEKIMEFLMTADAEKMSQITRASDFLEQFVSYVEVSEEPDEEKAVHAVLSGMIALVVDGVSPIMLIDGRTYPMRGVEEPDDDRVLRGAHDGFTETVVLNTALIRRRIRSTSLTFESFSVGRSSRTDVVVAYLDGVADRHHIEAMRKKIDSIVANDLTMAQESLTECLIKKSWWNPFPKVRYTERPDAAAAAIYEGRLIVIIDNSPSVIILPTTIFDFAEDANDFYFPPLVGTYLRFVRMVMFLATLLLTPLWFFLANNPSSLPESLSFLAIKEPAGIPLWLQLIVFELAIDGLKLASLNTPSALSNSFSVLGALILGDFAVQAHWFSAEVIMYMGLVAIGNFTQPSFELGYAVKLCRIMLIILIALFGLWGFIAGLVFIAVLLLTNRTVFNNSYLYPLIPFRGRALLSLFVRIKKRP